MLAHADRVDERGQEALVLGHDVVGERLQRRAPALLRVQRVPPQLLSIFVSFDLKIVNLKFQILFPAFLSLTCCSFKNQAQPYVRSKE